MITVNLHGHLSELAIREVDNMITAADPDYISNQSHDSSCGYG